VQSSGNSVLCSLLDGLSGPTTRARIWRGLTQEDAVSRTLHEHRAILAALRDRDGEAARSWATVHIASVEQWLRSTL
jgi:GntR family transcriptional regulator, transcriptional repressor for pyruvate dehydrogenase complex